MSDLRPANAVCLNEFGSLRLAGNLLGEDSELSMTQPRQMLPNGFYQITRRCMFQQFLLRPDDEINNAVIYCLGEASQRFEIDVIIPSFLSNHHHTDVFDPKVNLSVFMERFHGLLAKCVNVSRSRRESVWSSAEPSVVELADVSAIIDSVVYAAINPVRHGLVDRVHHWPGVNGLSALLNKRTLFARRPRFFRDVGPMPETIALELKIPTQLGDPDAFREIIRERVAKAEAEHAEARKVQGRGVLGRNRILRQPWREAPPSAIAPVERREAGKINPRFATRDPELREQLITRRQLFLRDYRLARVAWLAGTPIPFPVGTYWLRRFVGVPVSN